MAAMPRLLALLNRYMPELVEARHIPIEERIETLVITLSQKLAVIQYEMLTGQLNSAQTTSHKSC